MLRVTAPKNYVQRSSNIFRALGRYLVSVDATREVSSKTGETSPVGTL
jgi:hypothetical protein